MFSVTAKKNLLAKYISNKNNKSALLRANGFQKRRQGSRDVNEQTCVCPTVRERKRERGEKGGAKRRCIPVSLRA